MKTLNKLLLISLMSINFTTVYAQNTYNLNVSPNPFHTSTIIHFDLTQSDTVSLKVFDVYGKLVRTFFQSIVLPPGSYNIHFIADTLPDGIYFVRLYIGSTQNIAQKALKSSSASNVSQVELASKINIFPNPTNNFIVIPIDGYKTIKIDDISGKTLKTITTQQTSISLENFPSGQYIISILDKQNHILTTQKITKIE